MKTARSVLQYLVVVAAAVDTHDYRNIRDHAAGAHSHTVPPYVRGIFSSTIVSYQIIVWDMGDMRTVKVLEGYHRRAVTTVGFSPDGRLLATMGADDHHGLAVYDWENSVLVCTTRLALHTM